MALQHLRSNTASKRPTAGAMSDGQIAVNTNATSPGLFFKDAGGSIIKVGPVHVGTTAPNSSPAGSTGNSIGEQWLDTSGGGYVLKIWDGSAWRSEVGEFVDAAGDTMTGALILPSGTAAAPALGVGSTDNGLYSPGTDQVAISTNGTARLFVDANGNVGLGISPTTRFHVYQSGSTQGGLIETNQSASVLNFKSTGQSSGQPQVGCASSDMILNTNGIERLRITPTGTVNIVGAGTAGTTQAVHFNGSAPVNSLVVNSSGSVGIGTSSPATLLHLSGLNSGGGSANTIRVTDTDTAVVTDQICGRIEFETGDTGNPGVNCQIDALYSGSGGGSKLQFRTGFAGALVDALHISDIGSVGIGTTSPAAKLHIADSGAPEFRIVDTTTNCTAFLRPLDTYVRFGTVSNHPLLFLINESERMRVDTAGRLLVGTSTSRGNWYNGSGRDPQIQLEQSGNTRLGITRTDATNNGPELLFGKTDGSGYAVVSSDYELGEISFQGADGTELVEAANIRAYVDGTPGANDMPGRLVFSSTPSGSASPVERMRITNSGRVMIGGDFTASSNTTSYIVAGASSTSTGNLAFESVTGNAALRYHMAFSNPNGVVGGVTTDGSATAFNTSSDYRLKENVTAVTDGITRLQQLKPSRFNFIADPDKTLDGFLAHEVQTIVPEAITGEKDAVDDEGNPQYQGIDQSKLVPLLTAALQEAITRIETLEAEVAALKAQ